ncbi:MAG: disulfide bond formation protein B [Patescibacteria group bacterium]
MTLQTTNYLLALGTLVLQIAAISFFVVLILRKKFPQLEYLAAWIGSRSLWIAFILSLGASAMTLYYSEILGIEPCPLCWWQRIFLYSQVVIFVIALCKRDFSVAVYSMALSIIGAAFALYHHALQVLPAGALPCPAAGASCAQRFVFEFGYITFPMMALSLFAFLIVLMLFVKDADVGR